MHTPWQDTTAGHNTSQPRTKKNDHVYLVVSCQADQPGQHFYSILKRKRIQIAHSETPPLVFHYPNNQSRYNIGQPIVQGKT
jgi:hypothetical protein